MSVDPTLPGSTLSPQLSAARLSPNLSPNLKGQDSMITLGEANRTANDRFLFQTLNNDSTMLNPLNMKMTIMGQRN